MENIKCQKCNYESENKKDVMKHEQEEHNLYRCDTCDHTEYSKEKFELHQYSKHYIKKGERIYKYICQNCKERFYDLLDLEAHFDIMHIEGRNVKYTCEKCNFKSFYKRHYNKHMKTVHCKTAI